LETLVYTSAQWHSTSLLNKIIKAGVLCVELTNLYATLLKVGNGKDRWVDLPYIPDLKGYYTKEEIDSFNAVINQKISELEADKHTHDNKEILDKITKEFTIEDKEKLDSITPYDDKEVNKRLTNLEKDSHTHKNKSLLDQTTAVFTTEYEYIITHMATYDVFVGATATKPGTEGLVPAPKAGDNEKFLRGDGNWVTVESKPYKLPPATRSTLGGVKVGNNINVDANGVISVTFPPIPEPYELPIASDTTLGGVKIGDGLVIDENGVVSATGIGTIPPATTTTIGGVIVGDGISVENDGTISVTQYQSGIATEIISGESVDIPDAYQRVEYIQSDTTQYIDTGYTQRSGSCFRIEVCPLQDPNLQSTQQVIFGNYVTTYNTQSYQVCWYMNDQNIYQFTFGISNTINPAYTYFTGYYDQYIVAHVYNDTIEIYDSNDEYLLVKKTLNQSIGDGANTIAIFCKHVDDHYDSKSKMKLRRFSIYSQLNSQNEFDDQYLVMDMYPVVRISDNVAGLYDVITETFFSSPVGNDFIVGPNLYADTRINVKYNDGLDVNSNNELINTGVLDVSLNQSDSSILDVEFADETKHIQIPETRYQAGDGIDISETNTADYNIEQSKFEQGTIIQTSGILYDETDVNVRMKDYFAIKPEVFSIGLTGYTTNNESILWSVIFYDSDKTYLSGAQAWFTTNETCTKPADAAFIKIILKIDDYSSIDETDIGACHILLTGQHAYTISATPATASNLGSVKIGNGINVTQDGTISVDPSITDGFVQSVSLNNNNGNIIVTDNSGDEELDVLQYLDAMNLNVGFDNNDT
jgi:hypothetical protein